MKFRQFPIHCPDRKSSDVQLMLGKIYKYRNAATIKQNPQQAEEDGVDVIDTEVKEHGLIVVWSM